MEITFSGLRTREVVNLYDGKRLGRIIDIAFDKETGKVLGFIVPQIKKIFKKNEDIFIPLELVKKIGEDVILVKLSPITEEEIVRKSKADANENKVYARYKRTPVKEQ